MPAAAHAVLLAASDAAPTAAAGACSFWAAILSPLLWLLRLLLLQLRVAGQRASAAGVVPVGGAGGGAGGAGTSSYFSPRLEAPGPMTAPRRAAQRGNPLQNREPRARASLLAPMGRKRGDGLCAPILTDAQKANGSPAALTEGHFLAPCSCGPTFRPVRKMRTHIISVHSCSWCTRGCVVHGMPARSKEPGACAAACIGA